MSTSPRPPVAPRRDHVHREHGIERSDPYHWLRERQDPAVTAYLEAENRHTADVLRHTEPQQERLYAEMLGRIQQTDHSVPVRWGPFLYYTRTTEGQAYSKLCRRPHAAGPPSEHPDAAEQIVFDENALAEGLSYLDVGDWEPDPSHERVAYVVDSTGDESHALQIVDLRTGQLLPDRIEGLSTSLAWSADGRVLFYVRLDAALRPYALMRHVVGTPVAEDVLVHEEADEAFFVGVHRSRSGRFIVLDIDSRVTSEVHLLDASDPEGSFFVVAPRRAGVEYSVTDHGDSLLILTNEDALNFRVMATAVSTPQREHWVEKIPHRPDVKLDGIAAFAEHLVITRRQGGFSGISVEEVATGEVHDIEMPEPVSSTWLGHNPEAQTSTLRFGYTSLVTPASVYDYDLRTRTRVLRKQRAVAGYDRAQWVSTRIDVTAADGTAIPVSLVHHAELDRSRPQPMLLSGYGAYGLCSDPVFSSNRVSLLERGMIVAIAHVRGGGEMGRVWYEAGRREHKGNTFTDFIACAEALISAGYTSPERLAIRGGSAGGLLMGAVINMRPELFGAVVADVPFVDVLNTMLDPTLPLTVIEYDEWGDPRSPEAFEIIRSYAPYENVRPQAYPPMLVLAGLNDPRVGYFEPAKWVAKLRAERTDDRTLVLRTDMESGHGGPSGRYDALRETALWFSFVLDELGLLGEPPLGVAKP